MDLNLHGKSLMDMKPSALQIYAMQSASGLSSVIEVDTQSLDYNKIMLMNAICIYHYIADAKKSAKQISLMQKK